MRSLKAVLPQLAAVLGEMPGTLYERQRALIRADLFEVRPGRGPGSGVVASVDSVATLLLSMISSTSLADAPVLTKSFADAASFKKCPITGKKTFADALKALIGDVALARRVKMIVVQSGAGTCQVFYDDTEIVVFAAKVPSHRKIRVGLSIAGETLTQIAELVATLETEQ